VISWQPTGMFGTWQQTWVAEQQKVVQQPSPALQWVAMPQGAVPQLPDWQVWSLAQTFPQAPQLAESLLRSMH